VLARYLAAPGLWISEDTGVQGEMSPVAQGKIPSDVPRQGGWGGTGIDILIERIESSGFPDDPGHRGGKAWHFMG